MHKSQYIDYAYIYIYTCWASSGPRQYIYISIRQDLIWYMYMLGLVSPIHSLTRYLHAVFLAAHMPIQSVYHVLQPAQYLCSGHVLASIKISCAIHTR